QLVHAYAPLPAGADTWFSVLGSIAQSHPPRPEPLARKAERVSSRSVRRRAVPLRAIGYQRFRGQDQGADRGRILQRGAGHLQGIDDSGPEEILDARAGRV